MKYECQCPKCCLRSKTGSNLCYPHTKAKRTAKADAERQGGKSLDVSNEAQKDNAALEALLDQETKDLCGYSSQGAVQPPFNFAECCEIRSKSTITDNTEGVIKLDHIAWLYHHTTKRRQSEEAADKKLAERDDKLAEVSRSHERL